MSELPSSRRTFLRTTAVGVIGTVGAIGATQTGAATEAAPTPDEYDDILDGMAGSGSDADPYVITDVVELQAMAGDTESNYELGTDIDASPTASWNDGSGFEPIGDWFSGSLNGNGYEIAGLTIDRPDEDGIGLFHEVDGSNAAVEALSLINIDIVGNGTFSDPIGGLAGVTGHNVEITNVTVSGTVVGTTGNRIGLLIGNSDSTITNCNVSGSVSGSRRVGGLVGRLGTGEISDCHSSATVSAIDTPGDSTGEFGGLVGDVQGSSVVRDSSATGAVDGIDDAGGLVGQLFGDVRRCYATGNVHCDGGAAGLVHNVGDNAVIDQAYATGDVTGEGANGGLCRWIRDGSTLNEVYAAGNVPDGSGLVAFFAFDGNEDNVNVTSAYWDEAATGTTDSVVGTGLQTAEMQGNAAEANMTGFDFAGPWETTDGYPTLQQGDQESGDREPGEHESGVSQELFDAVDQDGSNDLNLGELRDAVDDWSQDQRIGGVDATLSDLRALIEWW